MTLDMTATINGVTFDNSKTYNHVARILDLPEKPDNYNFIITLVPTQELIEALRDYIVELNNDNNAAYLLDWCFRNPINKILPELIKYRHDFIEPFAHKYKNVDCMYDNILNLFKADKAFKEKYSWAELLDMWGCNLEKDKQCDDDDDYC